MPDTDKKIDEKKGDGVLKRMLKTPPEPKTPPKRKPGKETATHLIQRLVRAFILAKHAPQDAVNGCGPLATNPDVIDDSRFLPGISVSINDEARKGYVDTPINLPKFGNKVRVKWGDIVGANYIDIAAVRELNCRTIHHPNLSSFS